METMPKAGMTGQWETTVEEGLLAAQVGSGEVRVLATPMMIMGMERAAMEAVRELIDSGEWDVFSGVKLNITVDAEAGTAAVEQVDAPLMSDGYELKDGEVVEMANPEIVPAGGASVTDDVIKSGMNYNVAGVVEG